MVVIGKSVCADCLKYNRLSRKCGGSIGSKLDAQTIRLRMHGVAGEATATLLSVRLRGYRAWRCSIRLQKAARTVIRHSKSRPDE
jgi:hypothetical protein